MTTATIDVDVTLIRDALELLVTPDGVVEVRVPDAGRAGTVSGYYDDLERLAHDAIRLNRQFGTTFVTLNEITPALLARAANRWVERAKYATADHDVTRRRWLLVDTDPPRPAGISSTDAEHQAALTRADEIRGWLAGRGWPNPVWADSGNGGHLLYRIDQENTATVTDLLRRCLAALAFRFNDGMADVDLTTFNASRVCKLYGTIAGKGDSIPDRPHRLARILERALSPTLVPLDLLQALAETLPPEPESRTSGQGPGSRPGRFDVDAWIILHGLSVARTGPWGKGGRRWILSPCPWNPEHTDNAAYIVQFADGALGAGCHHNGCAERRWPDLRALFEPERRSWTRHDRADVDRHDRDASNEERDTDESSRQESIAVIPELPKYAVPTPAAEAVGREARVRWLDRYILAARALSPRTSVALHEACAIFAVCLAIARRCHLVTGTKRHYPALYQLFIGRSTIRAKTSGLDALRTIMDRAGLSDLLLPARFTPQALAADLSLWVHPGVRDGTEKAQERWLERHRHGAARGIVRDEASGLFDDCSKDYNTGLLPLLLELDGAPDRVSPDLTISRGEMEIEHVGISLLGATTPAALRAHAAGDHHWRNGLFGRFALIAPGDDPHWAFWDQTATARPDVIHLLRRVYDAFPRPYVGFEYAEDREESKGKRGDAGPRIIGAAQAGYIDVPAKMTPATWDAYGAYDRALFELAARPEHPERMDPTYGRLPGLALRVALVLAAAEWAQDERRSSIAPVVSLGHWIAAQEIAERWRADAHRILAAALDADAQESTAADIDALIRVLEARGRLHRGDVLRGLKWKSARLTLAISGSSGKVVEVTDRDTGGRPARIVMRAGLASSGPEGSRDPGADEADTDQSDELWEEGDL